MENTLLQQSHARQAAQDQHLKLEKQAFDEVCKNLDLKRLQFQLNYQVTNYNAQS